MRSPHASEKEKIPHTYQLPAKYGLNKISVFFAVRIQFFIQITLKEIWEFLVGKVLREHKMNETETLNYEI